ncbi:hypothetical protein [Algoriphagus confluentis]|uniref:Zinc-finger domain-containing protein n=1 Tax=Algoriphagus confluentis TaxID=1697556 RepID=A0ABQ6PXN7_9BACT|nr:hypothetical protein Aconfl_41520 [Algoriphagus confluentis]
MKSSHLTEENLQAYLLGEIQEKSIAEHLSTCSGCQKNLEEYHRLLERIQKINHEPFPFDLTALAMETVIRYEKKRSLKREWVFWGSLFFLLLGISSLSIPYFSEIKAILYPKSSIINLLTIGTGLAVLFFLTADLIRQFNKKTTQLFKNNMQPTA